MLMSKSKYTIDQLPELPLETLKLGGELEFSSTEPVLTLKAPPITPPDEISPTPTAVPTSQHAVRQYITQATYPRVVCHPLPELFELAVEAVFEREQKPLRESRADLHELAGQTHYYKLTRHEVAKKSGPLFCTVKYGPWAAVAREEESCFIGVPSRWTFHIVEMPQVALIWDGEWMDIPVHLYPNLHVITGDLHKVGEAYPCCDGYEWCPTTGSCIQANEECKDPWPV